MLSVSPAPAQNKKMASKSGQNIKVFVRIKPLGLADKYKNALECGPGHKDVLVREKIGDRNVKKFSFDKVFPGKAKQMDIYKNVAKPLVDEVLDGYNCTIFAYGQTGSGKTYTMEGSELSMETLSLEENPEAGIIPRCVNQLFDELRLQKIEFTVRVSFLELYNEELFDLLSAQNDLTKLRLFEDSARKGSCIIQGLEEVQVRSKTDVYQIIKKGSQKRQTAATLMNAHSSRSHTVFTVTVHMKENTVDGDELLKIGKLHLVDLAGSENIGRSGAVDKRAREAGNINQSLLTLGRVISALTEMTPHVPYRESKLTRLLQDALGGRTKTSIIATVSGVYCNVEETLSTLDYAHRAKNIQNKPEVNKKLNKREVIGEYANEIEKLRRDLLAMREKTGVYLAKENYEDMTLTIDAQAREITDKITYIRSLEEEREKQLELFTQTEEKLEKTTEQYELTKETLKETTEDLRQTESNLEEQMHLVSTQEQTENLLQDHARSLIDVASTTTDHIDKLQNKIERKRKIECVNEETGLNFEKDFQYKISSMQTSVNAFKSHREDQSQALTSEINTYGQTSRTEYENLHQNVSGVKNEMFNIMETLEKFFNEKMNLVVRNCDQSLNFISENSVAETNSIKEFLEKTCRPFFSDVASTYNTLENTVVETLQKNLETVNSMNENMTKSHAEISTAFKIIESKAAEISEILPKFEEKINEKSKNIESSKNQFVEQLTLNFNKMMKDMQSFEGSLNENIPIISTHEKDEIQTISAHSQQVISEIKKTDAISKELLSTNCNMGTETELFVQDKKKEILTDFSEIRSKNEKFSVELEDKNAKTVQILDKTVDQCSEFKKQMCEQSKTDTAELKNMNTRDSTNLNEKFDGISENLNIADENLQRILFNNVKKVNDMCSEMGEFMLDQNDNLQDVAISFEHFLHEKLVKDAPSGLTPARMEYKFSTNIAATSPHERIIQRYREAKPAPEPIMEIESTTSGHDVSQISTVSQMSDVSEASVSESQTGFETSSRHNSALSTVEKNTASFAPKTPSRLPTKSKTKRRYEEFIVPDAPVVSTKSLNKAKNAANSQQKTSKPSDSESKNANILKNSNTTQKSSNTTQKNSNTTQKSSNTTQKSSNIDENTAQKSSSSNEKNSNLGKKRSFERSGSSLSRSSSTSSVTDKENKNVPRPESMKKGDIKATKTAVDRPSRTRTPRKILTSEN